MGGRHAAVMAVTVGLTAMAVAACSSAANSHPAPTRSPEASRTAVAAESPAVTAARLHAAQFARWLAAAAQNPADVQGAISGAVMQDYARFESLKAEADGASGSPDQPETVTPAADGYRLCADDNGSETCDALTGFRADDAGKITDLEVNGQLVSPRLGRVL
jgi:hypothetical protein